MSPAEWSASVERFRQLAHEWELARGNSDARSRCAQEHTKLIADAATRLPARGEVIALVDAALADADIESAEHLFAVNVMLHRYQFPRRFLPAVIVAAVRHGKDGYRIVASAAGAYGADAVVRELIAIAKTRRLDAGVADFFLYYIGSSRTETSLAQELRSLTTNNK